MPLYKTKIPPRRTTLINNCLQTTKNNFLKIPERNNKNKLNDNTCKRGEEDKICQQKTGLKTNISAEMCISFNKINAIESAVNGDLKLNEKKDISLGVKQNTNATDDIKKNVRNTEDRVIDNGFIQRNKSARNKTKQTCTQKNIEQADKSQSKEIVISKKSKKILDNTNAKKRSINNNTEKLQSQVKKSKNRKYKQEAIGSQVPSELAESVISLWSQEQIPTIEPPEHFTHRERLLWLQEQRNVGLYVCCDMCNKYRYLKDTTDPLELPEKWYCHMNPGININIPLISLS